jgi:hypothetical protein
MEGSFVVPVTSLEWLNVSDTQEEELLLLLLLLLLLQD